MVKNIIFDWKRTLYDPENKLLIPGVLDLLLFLKRKKILVFLVGKGNEEMYHEVERLQLKKYFSDIVFREGEKNELIFRTFVSARPKETVFIGDRVRSELEIGNKLGAITVWLKQGKFAKENPLNDFQKPTFTVNSISELKNLLSRF